MSYSPPAYFKPILESEHYKVYENTRPLPLQEQQAPFIQKNP